MFEPRPFVVFSLPRSRSTWASVFLSRPMELCAHDLGPRCDAPEEFAALLRTTFRGTCETGAAFAADAIRKLLPDVRVAVIRRDPAAVVRSLEAHGILGQEGEMWGRARDLDRIADRPDSFVVEFDELNTPRACAELYHRCLGTVPPAGWVLSLIDKNIQVNLPRELEMLAARRPQIERMKARARELACA